MDHWFHENLQIRTYKIMNFRSSGLVREQFVLVLRVQYSIKGLLHADYLFAIFFSDRGYFLNFWVDLWLKVSYDLYHDMGSVNLF